MFSFLNIITILGKSAKRTDASKATEGMAHAEDPNRIAGMPILRHSISGKSTGAVSNLFECKRVWGPYLELKYGKARRLVRDGKFPTLPQRFRSLRSLLGQTRSPNGESRRSTP